MTIERDMVIDQLASKQRDTVLRIKNRNSKNRDGGKAKLGERSHLYACSSPKELCTGKFNSKVNAYAHGSPEDAMRCIRRAIKAKQEELNDHQMSGITLS